MLEDSKRVTSTCDVAGRCARNSDSTRSSDNAQGRVGKLVNLVET